MNRIGEPSDLKRVRVGIRIGVRIRIRIRIRIRVSVRVRVRVRVRVWMNMLGKQSDLKILASRCSPNIVMRFRKWFSPISTDDDRNLAGPHSFTKILNCLRMTKEQMMAFVYEG